MVRRLVTLRRVSSISPIPDADRIVLAHIDGWQCVVKTDEFSPGSLGVYFEIDSFLPASDSRYDFLAPKIITWQDTRGVRIKTLRLRGQISQGLLLPLNTFPEIQTHLATLEATLGKAGAEVEALERSDFTAILGVQQWEKPIGEEQNGGPVPKSFPDFIAKTDQGRVQNIRGLFKTWADTVFQETTKMDGSSMTVYHLDISSPYFSLQKSTDIEGVAMNYKQGVCSRNIEIPETPSNKFWAVARANNILEKLHQLGRSIAVQGELCGEGIQGNFEGFKKGFTDFFVFDVWDISTQKHYLPEATQALALQLGLQHVPVHGYVKLSDVGGTVGDLVARAEGKGINGKKREGIVFKAKEGGMSFKAISNSYLLKHGE